MKKNVTLICAAFALVSFGAYADYDPRDDPNSPQNIRAAKIAKERAAQQKVENAKRAREIDLKAKRARLGKEAEGKLDADIDKLDAARADAEKIKMTKEREEAERAAAIASDAYKAQTGKSLVELQAMSEKDRAAFMKAQQQKQSDNVKATTGFTTEQIANMTPDQRKQFMEKMKKLYGS